MCDSGPTGYDMEILGYRVGGHVIILDNIGYKGIWLSEIWVKVHCRFRGHKESTHGGQARTTTQG